MNVFLSLAPRLRQRRRFGRWPWLLAAGLAWLGVAGPMPAAGAGGKEAKKAPPANAATNAVVAPPVLVIPQSVFTVDPLNAVDPFFPKAKPGVSNSAPSQPVSSEFKLRAVLGSANHRLALINNRTFEAGEEGKVTCGTTKVSIRCLEIRERSVTIMVEGKDRKELYLH
jgi:hypothetical protein